MAHLGAAIVQHIVEGEVADLLVVTSLIICRSRAILSDLLPTILLMLFWLGVLLLGWISGLLMLNFCLRSLILLPCLWLPVPLLLVPLVLAEVVVALALAVHRPGLRVELQRQAYTRAVNL